MAKHHVTIRSTPGAPALRDVLINGHSYRIHRAMTPADADIRAALIVAQFHDMGARCAITDETAVAA